jgi:hypothetical protein
MLLLLLGACNVVNGPTQALLDAKVAYDAQDLDAFEAIVDVDAVAPQVAEGCVAMAIIDDWEERQFRPQSTWEDAGLAFGANLLSAAINAGSQDIAASAREDFGTKPVGEYCDGLDFAPGKPKVTIDGDRATALIPVTVHGVATDLPVDMANRETGWKVIGVDVQATIDGFKAASEANAAVRAGELMGTLESDASAFSMLETYLANHPEDTKLIGQWESKTADVLAATAPVKLDRATLGRGGMLRGRGVRVLLSHEAEQPVRTVWVRIVVVGSGGNQVQDTEVATIPWMGEDTTFETPINVRVRDPDAVDVQGTVVKVVYADLSEWVHPAIEKGWWSL